MTLKGSDDLDLDYYYYNDRMGDLDSDDGNIDSPLSVKHLYHSSTWEKSHIEYDSKPKEFTGTSCSMRDFPRFPTFFNLFELFWPDGPILLKIVKETNRYATTTDEHGISLGRETWERLTIAGLKGFLICTILIGLKRQPNRKTYWETEGSFFHCLFISSVFTREKFQTITNCLHITNLVHYVHDRGAPGYDKICNAFKREWD
jgi:hypothetical protein